MNLNLTTVTMKQKFDIIQFKLSNEDVIDLISQIIVYTNLNYTQLRKRI